ncbi:MAG: SUMF1/EgtB/PvdO family nonheme iron enzyme [Sediminibacterium sp.]|nr:SUMF1/EgtB/PvdO family nonheme iron enzyme [Sediminibacterium sp.]
MKLIKFLSIFLFILITSCNLTFNNFNDGQVRETIIKTKSSMPNPVDMVYIKSGSFLMGQNDEEISYNYLNKKKQVTIDNFWMDKTEVTNNKYRTFVEWVRKNMIYRQIFYEGVYAVDFDNITLDEKKYRSIRFNNKATLEKLSPLFTPEEDRIDSSIHFDNRKLRYHVSYLDLIAKIKDEKNRINKNIKEYLVSYNVQVYPDTLVWLKDFSYSYNEPFSRLYYNSPSYGRYPVVGISWKQAFAYCNFKTKYLKQYLIQNKKPMEGDYRLPNEAEWEYAARGGRANVIYPWNGPNTMDIKGRFLANFKPQRGNYAIDGYAKTQAVGSYFANDFGLFDMAGNVAEWTASLYYEGSYNFMSDLNPDIRINNKESDAPRMKRKVIRGGSWKDVAYYLQVGSRSSEFQDNSNSYTGFRCVFDKSPIK